MKFFSVLVMLAVAAVSFAQDPMGEPIPAAELKKIEFMLGSWKGKLKFHMGPQTVEADADVETAMRIGGRFLHGMNKYTMPGAGAIEGLHVLTYDAKANAYRGWWFDQMSSEVMELTGTFEGNKLVMMAKPVDVPGMPGAVFRATYESKGPKEMTFELAMKAGDSFTPVIEGTYTKK